ncbi:hypothetical protein CDD83_9768 [Cordyceps sp. RAO-2017]|nr:hypothetical protein CDD83_9768 [Cordyceps sp. RAO-2017]
MEPLRRVAELAGRYRRPRIRKQPSAPCVFLDVPPEIILLIAEELPQGSRILLSQACRALRAIMKRRFQLDTRHPLPDGQAVDLLACLARGRPDHWACSVCLRLHRVPSDGHLGRSCPVRPGEYGRGGRRYGHYPAPGPPLQRPVVVPLAVVSSRDLYCLGHHHMQLALKCERILREGTARKKHQRFLDQALRPASMFIAGSHGRSAVRFTIMPKIARGRFLIKTEWLFHSADICRVALTAIVQPCPHQSYDHVLWLSLSNPRASGRTAPLNDGARAGLSLYNAVSMAATSIERNEIRGTCPWCCTDFSVRGDKDQQVICAWRDLGPEGVPSDIIWRSQINHEAKMTHKPGSARQLYDADEGGKSGESGWKLGSARFSLPFRSRPKIDHKY